MTADPDLTYAIIPARGGSKGIPRKNLATVGGRALVTRAVQAAARAERVDRVVVSTDDDEIADAARRAGADVVERPVELSGDQASSESALLHALDSLRQREGREPDICVLVQCTSPFLHPDDVDGVVSLVEQGADSAFTATPSHTFLWRDGDDGAVGVNHDAGVRLRRQELTPEVAETGGAYAMRVAGFRQTGHRFFGRIAFHLVPPVRGLEIDEPADLEQARALHALVERGIRPSLPSPLGALVLDFDGVLTDNRVLTLQDGTEGVLADRGDGMGLEALRELGLPLLVLSKERNPVVAARCAKLQVELVQGVDDKAPALARWLTDRGIDPATVIYVGNDVNDRECLELVGYPVVVGDAHPDVAALAAIVLGRPGGRGAVRELADLILEHQRNPLP